MNLACTLGDDMANAADVDATGADIGRYQDTKPAVAKAGERALSRVLRLVAVNGIGADAAAEELLGDTVCTALCAGEDECMGHGAIPQQRREQPALFSGIDEEHALSVTGNILAATVIGDRVAVVTAWERTHIVTIARKKLHTGSNDGGAYVLYSRGPRLLALACCAIARHGGRNGIPGGQVRDARYRRRL